eukprot:9678936-Ditylum_brightwellii.AAC.1
MSFSTNGEPGCGDVRMHEFWSNKGNGLGIPKLRLAPLFHSAISIQLHLPPHDPVNGRTATNSTFNSPHQGFKPGVSDFQDLAKRA